MTEPNVNIILTSIGCGIVSGIVLALLHVLFWKQPWQLSRPAAYTVGLLTIGCGVLLACWLLGDIKPFLVGTSVALPSGAVVVFCYYLRGVFQAMEKGRKKRTAFVGLVIEELEDATPTRSNTRNN